MKDRGACIGWDMALSPVPRLIDSVSHSNDPESADWICLANFLERKFPHISKLCDMGAVVAWYKLYLTVGLITPSAW